MTQDIEPVIKNESFRDYHFLKGMSGDSYYPIQLVKKGEEILKNLCITIEKESPKTLEELYVLTNIATEKFNDLEIEFGNQNSEIDTVAREYIGSDFFEIAKGYGFIDADIEELIAEREW